MSLISPAALILCLLILANLPWSTKRIFLVYPVKTTKSIVIRLIELLIYYFIGLLLANMVEMNFSGDIVPQQWEFYVTTFCLFVVLSVPSVVYHYQWLRIF